MDGAHDHEDLAAAIAALQATTASLEGRVAGLESRVDALEAEPIAPDFPIAWWAETNHPELYAEAGFTHNVIWNSTFPVEYLDELHALGVKAIPLLRPEMVGHPAIVAAIVADEPDLMTAGVPKRSIDLVANTAEEVAALWPGLPIFSTMGSPCGAGPLSETEPESVPAGFWSLNAVNSVEGDQRFAAYADAMRGQDRHVIVAPQIYTVAGDPVRAKFRRQDPLADLNATEAGTRQSDFVPKAMARAARLLPGVELWGLLACAKFNDNFGRHPTLGELVEEAAAVHAAGGTGVLWFDMGVLASDDAQRQVVSEAISELMLTLVHFVE